MYLNKSNIIKVALPNEHGAWGFFFEPILLALIVSFSYDGIFIAISSFFLFLTHQPSSYVIKGKLNHLFTPAVWILICYLVIASIPVYNILRDEQKYHYLLPYGMAILLMIGFKIFERFSLKRKLIVEFIPQIAVALFAISILLPTKWDINFLVFIFIVIISRSIQTVIYIHNKLKISKGYIPNRLMVNMIGLIFFIILLYSAFNGYSPFLSLIALGILIIRSVVGLQNINKKELVKIVGIKEFIYGFLFVVINSFGYIYGI